MLGNYERKLRDIERRKRLDERIKRQVEKERLDKIKKEAEQKVNDKQLNLFKE